MPHTRHLLPIAIGTTMATAACAWVLTNATPGTNPTTAIALLSALLAIAQLLLLTTTRKKRPTPRHRLTRPRQAPPRTRTRTTYYSPGRTTLPTQEHTWPH